MMFKYVRHEIIGFILWPFTDDLWHKHVGDLAMRRVPGKIVSAGFVSFDSGYPHCHGRSESLGIGCSANDSDDLASQMDVKS